MLAIQVFGGSAHSNIAIEFGFRGVGTTNSNSCASGTVSVGEALRYIRDDFADVIVAGGAEAPLSALTIGAFDIIKTMSRCDDPTFASRPFDHLRDGFVMGEGAASLIVEELEHARTRGARIYAEVLGYSLNNDAFHMTAPLPSGESCIRTMCDALADAQLAPEQIDYINAHASSTRLNDSTETMSIKEVFGQHAGRIPVSGTKGYTAHPLGATGAIEAAICGLALDRQWIPPTINYQNPDPACDLDVVPNHGRAAKLNYIMSNSFGFGGINACVVLGKYSG
jgi:3-oxoacyl-[acyl-carrier-protein] synthase II